MAVFFKRSTYSGAEPITLTEAKAFLRVDSSDDDSYITELITMTRDFIEKETNTALVSNIYTEYRNGFPTTNSGIITLQINGDLTIDNHTPIVEYLKDGDWTELNLGPELVTNGDFSDGTTGWEAGDSESTLSIDDGQLKLLNDGTDSTAAMAATAINIVSGATYAIRYESAQGTSANTATIMGIGTSPNNMTILPAVDFTGDGVHSYTWVSTYTGAVFFTLKNGTVAEDTKYMLYDNVIIREITEDYFTAEFNGLPRIEPNGGWSVTPDARLNSVKITYTAAPPEAGVIAPPLKQAMYLLLAHYYDNRSAVTFGNPKELPLGYKRIINNYKNPIWS